MNERTAGIMELARIWLGVKVQPDADLEADEEGEGQRYGDDPPRDHGEEPAADSDAAVRLVG